MSEMVYHHPKGAKCTAPGRLVTPQGGEVIVDRLIQEIWEYAGGRSLEEIYQANIARQYDPAASELDIALALACLAEAGLLSRNNSDREGDEITRETPEASNSARSEELVSTVIVSYNSQEWLPACLDSLQKQSYRPLEVIVVDNGSMDGSADWLKEAVKPGNATFARLGRTDEGRDVPERTVYLRAIYQDEPTSLSVAINHGIRQARGKFYFLLNPDTRLEAQAIAALVSALQEPEVQAPNAAAAAKLKLMWTPGFLNGLGNTVGAISWGMDIGLGHLDLGQFDDWRAVPSACFAAAMIPAAAWTAIGPLDENLPMYYEDSEWCYRARLLGWQIAAAPQAVVYHALGGRISNGQKPGNGRSSSANPAKQQRVVYGRLHFITRLLGPASWLRFMAGYFVEDFVRWSLAALKRQANLRKSICDAWRQYIRAFSQLRQENRQLREKRKQSDRQFLKQQVMTKTPMAIPRPLVRQGVPQLTWELVRSYYGPILIRQIQAGKTDHLLLTDKVLTDEVRELQWARSHLPPELLQAHKPGLMQRARIIYHLEGRGALVERIAKTIQHALR